VDPVTALDQIDLTDMGAMGVGDPHAAWRLLREQAPVFWHEKGTHGTRGKGFWAVSTFEGCTEVHRRSELFSNSDTEFMDLLPEDIPYQLSSMDPPGARALPPDPAEVLHRQGRGALRRRRPRDREHGPGRGACRP